MKLIRGDCLEEMKNIESGSIDLILTDPPYGTSACKWDSIININLMWTQLNRIIKNNGAIVLFGSEPFSSALRMSNIDNYKYDWIWFKSQATGHLNSWKMPMRNTENIHVFYNHQCLYNPQLLDKPIKNIRPVVKRSGQSNCYGNYGLNTRKCPNDKSMPATIIKFNNAQNTIHPTQKPVDLMEYLIKTYTNEGETVLDFTMGSGTTAIACFNENREFIGIELDKHYYNIANERVLSEMINARI